MNTDLSLIVFLLIIMYGAFFWFRSMYYSIKLYLFLKKTNYKKWRYLTSIGNFGPGFNNIFRWFPYIRNNEDIDDLSVLKYKDAIISNFRMACLSFIALIITVIIFVFFMVSSK